MTAPRALRKLMWAWGYAMTGLLVGLLVIAVVLLLMASAMESPWYLLAIPVDVFAICCACWLASICCDRSLDA